MDSTKPYDVTLADGYIWQQTRGEVTLEGLKYITDQALALKQQHGIDVVLCDFTAANSASVGLDTQAGGMSQLWKARGFRKMAFLFPDEEGRTLIMGTLKATHLDNKFRVFDNRNEAVAWLTSDA